MIIITSFVIIEINGSGDSESDLDFDCNPPEIQPYFDHLNPKQDKPTNDGWTDYKVLHGYDMSYHRFLWNTYSNKSVISPQQQHILRSETIPIDCCMTSLNMSLEKNKLIQQILTPFLVNSSDDKIRMFKYDDVAKPFIVFEIGNRKITKWMEQIRAIFPYDKRFHPKFVDTHKHKTDFQTVTTCVDLNLMRNEFELIQAQLDVVIKTHEMLSNNKHPIIRYLTNWIDTTMSKWLQKKVYGSNDNSSLSEIKDIIEAQLIHTDGSYDLTFTLFVTSDNYDTMNASDSVSHEQGMYLVPETNKKYLLKLHNDRIIFAIFPSKMIHFTQYVNVKNEEIVHNVLRESDRIWRLSNVMQTKLKHRDVATILNDMIN